MSGVQHAGPGSNFQYCSNREMCGPQHEACAAVRAARNWPTTVAFLPANKMYLSEMELFTHHYADSFPHVEIPMYVIEFC